MKKTTIEMPAGELRGRPGKYGLGELKKGEGIELLVSSAEELRSVRGAAFASAHNCGVKIKTKHFPAEMKLIVWRA